jgi:hypothetical protein
MQAIPAADRILQARTVSHKVRRRGSLSRRRIVDAAEGFSTFPEIDRAGIVINTVDGSFSQWNVTTPIGSIG